MKTDDKRTSKRLAVLLFLLAALLLSAPAAVEAQTLVRFATISSAGGTTSGGSFTTRATIGQPLAGSSGTFRAGFALAGGAPAIGTAIEDWEDGVPTTFQLHANYPNPFNPTTTVMVDLPAAGPTRLEVYDALGRLQFIALNGELPAGRHEVVIDADRLASGVYFYRVVAKGYTATQQMVLLK